MSLSRLSAVAGHRYLLRHTACGDACREPGAALYGTGHDPVSGEALGRPYPTYRSAEDRVAAAVGDLPDTLDADDLTIRHKEIEQTERARPTRTAVAGFNLTFTVPKSASVLWALGDRDVQIAVWRRTSKRSPQSSA